MIISTVKNLSAFWLFSLSKPPYESSFFHTIAQLSAHNLNKIRRKISPATTHYADSPFHFMYLKRLTIEDQNRAQDRLKTRLTADFFLFKYVRCIFTSENSEKHFAFLIPLLTCFLHLIFYFSNVYSITNCNLFSSECFSVSEILERLTSFLCLLCNFTRSRWVDFIFQRNSIKC